MNLSVSFPAPGRIRLESEELFRDPAGPRCRPFLERVLGAETVLEVLVRTNATASLAEIHFCHRTHTAKQVVHGIVALLRNGHPEPNALTAPAANGNGNGRRSVALEGLRMAPDASGTVRIYRHDDVVSTWKIRHELPGRLRLYNAALCRRKSVCQSVERELMSVLGVEQYKASPTTGTVLITYDAHAIRRDQIFSILDRVLAHEDPSGPNDEHDLDFPLCTVSVPFAATAQFVAPALLPAAALLFAYTAISSFKGAYDVLFRERRLGVDVLDSIVVLGCLGTGSIFAGSVLCWCLSFGRILVKKTRDDSKRMLLNVFGKQPRFVWLVLEDGTQIETPLEDVRAGSKIAVQTGETVPVDGIVVEGMAMIDQHVLTGESTPAEKGIGDRVYASTMMVAGKIYVQVERAGTETASAKISEILNNSAGYTLASQQRGEILADKAVIPTLAVGGLAFSVMGPPGAVAVLNSDFGTGIRMAAPLGMLTSLTLCAHHGILVKDGRALEMMNDVDTVLFDKTGTLTRERPEVGDVHVYNGLGSEEIVRFAAAAEQRFVHPIAKAIQCKFDELGLDLPPTDESKYSVGYGITVGVEGRTVRVGSARFMELEGIRLPGAAVDALDRTHREGHTLVMVAVDGELGGALELRASQRPEVRGIVQGLRDRGIEHLAIISGDHEAPTRKLAEELGMDRYFAGVLPEDKASYVEKLQSEGCNVCFVGDGINDSIALKKANVSISLRGASSIATDTAQIVFMEESLSRLCDLADISRDLDKNVRRSWNLILVPNILCIAGVFTAGFGIMTSVITNNVAALAALANGLLPLQRVARAQAERELSRELSLERLDG